MRIRTVKWLHIQSVRHVLDAMRMRAVRNECREFMTRDGRRISLRRQLAWYYETYKPLSRFGLMHAWLVWDGRDAVGWGFVRADGYGKAWVTGGLREDWRGKGLGRMLFAHMTSHAMKMNCEPWLEVFAWNGAAVGVYASLGYEEVGRVGMGASEVITMRVPTYE